MHLIDVNVWIQEFLGREKEENCRKFLTQVGKGDRKAAFTLFHADAVGVILQRNGLSRSTIKTFFSDLQSFRGLEVIELGLRSREAAMSSKEDLDFDDRMICVAYRAIDADILVSYDSDFDDVDGIKRKEPREIV